MNKRARGTIQGIVQGVGFRPFIYQLARRYHLRGHVSNTPQGVNLEVEGNDQDIELFFRNVGEEAPPLAHISSVERTDLPLRHDRTFEILESQAGLERSALISPDVGICHDCLSELRDPADRRFRYPFINCTHCGPRYTIIKDIPYDRAMTTMDAFEMCPACRREYEDPLNRRFHAQPNACWDCGPEVFLHDRDGKRIECDDPIVQCIDLLKRGDVVAIKGLGGFHLAVDASNHRAVVCLRRRKHREEKPLAIMVGDLETIRGIAHVDEREQQALLSVERPIVILKKRRLHGLSPQVAPRNRYFGIMLPYTPLHHLLMASGFKALVMTSGNISEEPITIDNDQAFKGLAGIADGFLIHNRDIYLRSDDSIIKIVDHVPRQIRRSRGFVPVPIFLPRDMSGMPPVLAVGAELKNTLCLTKENRVFLSQHVGDMDNMETFDFFHLTITHLMRILEIRPHILAHDLHPDYLSSRFAREQGDYPTMAVQHHHAHVVSCLAEHGEKGPVIGLALDGTGFGADGHLWGGEVLLADLTSYRRAACLEYVALPGGDSAIRFPWRMALSYLYKAYGDDLLNLPIPFIHALEPEEAGIIIRMVERHVHSPMTSSCGRLFDAVSALIGLRHRTAYEGQAAIELEMCQDLRENGAYPWRMEEQDHLLRLKTLEIIRGIVEDIKKGIGRGILSRRFHNTLIGMYTETCRILRDRTGMETVAMSGGAFQNTTLLTGLTKALSSEGFRILTQKIVPSNDGGISLGQAVCAGMRRIGWEGAFSSL